MEEKEQQRCGRIKDTQIIHIQIVFRQVFRILILILYIIMHWELLYAITDVFIYITLMK